MQRLKVDPISFLHADEAHRRPRRPHHDRFSVDDVIAFSSRGAISTRSSLKNRSNNHIYKSLDTILSQTS